MVLKFATDPLKKKWGSTEVLKVEGRDVLQTPEYAYFIPNDPTDKTFVMGELEEIKDLASSDGAPSPQRREIQRLLNHTDLQRHFTAVFAPNRPGTSRRENS